MEEKDSIVVLMDALRAAMMSINSIFLFLGIAKIVYLTSSYQLFNLKLK